MKRLQQSIWVKEGNALVNKAIIEEAIDKETSSMKFERSVTLVQVMKASAILGKHGHYGKDRRKKEVCFFSFYA